MPNKRPDPLLLSVTILLFVFNVLYWSGKFLGDSSGWIWSFYSNVKAHWKLLIFLELLAVVSLFVDMIVRYDKFEGIAKKWRMAMTALLFSAFVARLILGIIEMYMIGDVK